MLHEDIHLLLVVSYVPFNVVVYCFVFDMFCSDCAPKKAAPQGRDDAAARRLWDLSASMVGLA